MKYTDILQAQTAFFNSNKTKDLSFRVAQLRALENLLRSNEKQLYEAIYADFKKSEFETYATELSMLYHDIDEACRKLRKWSRGRRVHTNLANQPGKSFIKAEPYGNCLVIGAWNYPYQLSLAPAIAAIAAGNTVILKPSELAAHSSAKMADLINQHFDPGFFHVVQGAVAETTALLEEKFDKIFFTGSVPVGRIVYQAAAKHLTPVTLELGGKSPAIVMADCNLKVTARRIVWGKFLNAGQTCVAPDYVLVDASIEQPLLLALKEQIKAFDYSLSNGNYVQIINQRNFERLKALIDPAKIYCGGQSNAAERTIEPCLLSGVHDDDPVMQDEIFGPLLPVIPFNTLDEAIAKVKSKPKPLACYVFSSKAKHIRMLMNRLSFGGGAVNDTIMHITNSRLPFGGVGNSGMGNYHGEAGFKAFSHYKSVLYKPYQMETRIKYPPYSSGKLKWIKRMMG